MANIFTRSALDEIMRNEKLSAEERTEQVFSLYGRALDDGYVSKSAAKTAQETAIENAKAEWEKGVKQPDIKGSEEYKALQGEFDSFRTMTAARTSEDFKGVKPKFFETVYGMIDRKEGAKSVKDQLTEIREKYDEYFTASDSNNKPQFGAGTEGSMPKGDEGAKAAFTKAWGFVPQKG